MSKKVFLLGVGAGRCGSTWLHNQLVKNSNVDMGFTKEYQVFDAIYSSVSGFFRKDIINRVMEKKEKGNLARNSEDDPFCTKRLSFIDNVENYFDYFDYLFLKNDKVELVGDITPNYQTLNSDIFKLIKSGLESRGFTVKVVFVMRDPFEKIWSTISTTRRLMADQGKPPLGTDESEIERRHIRPETKAVVHYEKTIEELEKCFESKNIFYGFYEDMFGAKSWHNLCNVLTVDLETPEFNVVINASPKNSTISEDTKIKVVNEYRSVYETLDAKTQGYTRKIWSGYKYIE